MVVRYEQARLKIWTVILYWNYKWCVCRYINKLLCTAQFKSVWRVNISIIYSSLLFSPLRIVIPKQKLILNKTFGVKNFNAVSVHTCLNSVLRKQFKAYYKNKYKLFLCSKGIFSNLFIDYVYCNGCWLLCSFRVLSFNRAPIQVGWMSDLKFVTILGNSRTTVMGKFQWCLVWLISF